MQPSCYIVIFNYICFPHLLAFSCFHLFLLHILVFVYRVVVHVGVSIMLYEQIHSVESKRQRREPDRLTLNFDADSRFGVHHNNVKSNRSHSVTADKIAHKNPKLHSPCQSPTHRTSRARSNNDIRDDQTEMKILASRHMSNTATDETLECLCSLHGCPLKVSINGPIYVNRAKYFYAFPGDGAPSCIDAFLSSGRFPIKVSFFDILENQQCALCKQMFGYIFSLERRNGKYLVGFIKQGDNVVIQWMSPHEFSLCTLQDPLAFSEIEKHEIDLIRQQLDRMHMLPISRESEMGFDSFVADQEIESI